MRVRLLSAALLAAAACGEPAAPREVDLTGEWRGALRWQGDAEDELILTWPGSAGAEPAWRLSGGAVAGTARAESRRADAVVLRLEQRQPCPGDWRLRGLLVADDVIEATLDGSDCARSDEAAVTLRRQAGAD